MVLPLSDRRKRTSQFGTSFLTTLCKRFGYLKVGEMEQYVIIIEAQGWPVGTDTGVAAEWGPGESRWARAYPFSSWIEGKEGGDQG